MGCEVAGDIGSCISSVSWVSPVSWVQGPAALCIWNSGRSGWYAEPAGNGFICAHSGGRTMKSDGMEFGFFLFCAAMPLSIKNISVTRQHSHSARRPTMMPIIIPTHAKSFMLFVLVVTRCKRSIYIETVVRGISKMCCSGKFGLARKLTCVCVRGTS